MNYTKYTEHKADRIFSTAIDDFPKPHGKLEDWRFTPTRRFSPLAELPEQSQRALWTVGLTTAGAATLRRVAREESAAGSVELPSDRLAAVAWNGSPSVDVVQFAATDTPADPTVITIGTGKKPFTFGHLFVDVPAHTTAELLIYRSGAGALADNIEFSIADDASLTVAFVNLWDDDAVVASAEHAHLGCNAHLHHGVITLSGGATRITTSVTYEGPGGDADMSGIFFGGAGQHVEIGCLLTTVWRSVARMFITRAHCWATPSPSWGRRTVYGLVMFLSVPKRMALIPMKVTATFFSAKLPVRILSLT